VKTSNSKEVIIYNYVIIFILHLYQLTKTRLVESPVKGGIQMLYVAAKVQLFSRGNTLLKQLKG